MDIKYTLAMISLNRKKMCLGKSLDCKNTRI